MTVALWEFENGALDPTMTTNSEIRAVKFSLDRMRWPATRMRRLRRPRVSGVGDGGDVEHEAVADVPG